MTKKKANSDSINLNEVKTIGSVEFGVQYFSEANRLVVDLFRVYDLNMSEFDMSNEYLFCKCTLMPEKFSFQTKLNELASAIFFDEQFEFNYLESSHLDTYYLDVSIFEYEKESTSEPVGTVSLKLNYPNVETKKIFHKQLKFIPNKPEVSECGQACASF